MIRTSLQKGYNRAWEIVQELAHKSAMRGVQVELWYCWMLFGT